jgi:hypothetical protein
VAETLWREKTAQQAAGIATNAKKRGMLRETFEMLLTWD